MKPQNYVQLLTHTLPAPPLTTPLLNLLKVNIIRDFLEDLVDGRAYWPASITRRYVPSLAALRPEPGVAPSNESLACLNEMVADALALAPTSLAYLAALSSPAVFAFCAIPQVMAIETLAALTNNSLVFTGVVKIRKGRALVLMRDVGGIDGRAAVAEIFANATRAIVAAVPQRHTAARALLAPAAARIATLCVVLRPPSTPRSSLIKGNMFDHELVRQVLIILLGLLLIFAVGAILTTRHILHV